MAEEGLQQSGIVLVAKNYQRYLQQLQQVNKAQKDTFSGKGQAQFREEVKKTTKATKDAAKGTSAWRAALGMLTSGDILGGLRMLRKAILSIKMLLPELLALIGLAKVLTVFTRFAKVSGDVAQRNETLEVSLKQVGDTAGYTAEQIAYAEAAVRDKGITTQAARQSLIRMAQAEIEWVHAADLARIAQDAAVIGNINSSEAFERMINGIQRGETEILKTIGINVSFERSYIKLAEQLGVNRKELTEQQKAQARANAVLDAGKKIQGSYKAALETSGKQQKSLERYIEETQAAAGKLLLPFRELSVQMKTLKWKGLREIMVGLSSFAPVVRLVIEEFVMFIQMAAQLVGITLKLREGETIFMSIGRAIHDAARGAAFLIVAFKAVGTTIAEQFSTLFEHLSLGFKSLINMDFKGLGQAAQGLARQIGGEFKTDFTQNLQTGLQELHERFPDLFKDFSELGDVAKVSLELAASEADKLAAALAETQKQLEQQIGVLQKFEAIQDQFQRGQADALNKYNEKLADLEQDLAKSMAKAQEKASDAMIQLTEDAAESRADIESDYEDSKLKALEEHHRDMEQEIRRFELTKEQNARRFQLNERRLMAEGDVLALMQLREDEELRKQEEEENFDESQRTAQEQLEWELKNLKEGMDEQLKDLDESIAERRASITESYDKEMMDLVAANQERSAEATAQYQKDLERLESSRSEQLQALGKSYQEEGEITEDAMSEIAQKIANLYGDQGIYDAIMAGWDERTRGVMNELYEDAMDQLDDIARQMAYIEETGEVPGDDGSGSRRSRGTMAEAGGAYGMRQGGVGVVTGPALFEVEPGVKEIVAFAPVPSGMQHGQLDVGVSGNIGFPDAAASGASPAIVEAAVEQTLAEIQHAVKRLAKR
jgi:hypothetical protein